VTDPDRSPSRRPAATRAASDAAPTAPPAAASRPAGDAGVDPPADRAADVFVGEALGDLVGGALLADPGAAAWRDARFVAWLAAEARAADRASRRAGDAAFLARGEALLARAQARRLGVTRYDRPAAAARAGGRVREGVAVPAAGRAVPLVELGVAAGAGRELWDEPPARWVQLPDELPDARYVALRVVGTSMAPMLRSGDVVLVRADARGREPRAGRAVVARHPDDGYVCKRVESVEPRRLVLASLEPGHAPVVLPRDPALVVGTVVASWPGR
jgi:phage repressor protein C with HTH and peptisase S24 domain